MNHVRGQIMRVFGYMRFSYLGRSDARLSQTMDRDALFDTLFDENRMETRFRLFEKICLPAIKAQTNKAFRLFIAASRCMPDVYKSRLASLVADTPQIEIVYSDEANVTDIFNHLMAQVTANATQNCVHFRLDDDDAIANVLVEKLEAYADFTKEHGVISFPNGLYLQNHGQDATLIREYAPHIAIGFAFVNPPGFIKNPYQCGHIRYPRRITNVSVADICAFIHVAHHESDTVGTQDQHLDDLKAADPKWDSQARREEIAHELATYFPQFSIDGLKSAVCVASNKKPTVVSAPTPLRLARTA